MSKVREKGLILSIIKHCDRIESKMVSLNRETFDRDEDIREIICFNIFQIGELAKNFVRDFLDRHKTIPWKQIKGMRDIIGHGYGTIDLDRVWDTAYSNIKSLNEYCKKILEEY